MQRNKQPTTNGTTMNGYSLLQSLTLKTYTVDGHSSSQHLTPDGRFSIAQFHDGLFYWGSMPNCMTGETGPLKDGPGMPSLIEACNHLAAAEYGTTQC